ncbi:MAG: hypothetical protein K6G17_05135 [Oscillospiraceae bacterium]|nr:hypothetical protein [Oscillospiraceae bacterium]
MNAEYAPMLRPRTEALIRCGRCSCRYYCRETDSCDYLLTEYRRRGCPPDPDCARYSPRGKEDLPLTRLRMQNLYGRGFGDAAIAGRLGLPEEAVRRWRERRGAPERGG